MNTDVAALSLQLEQVRARADEIESRFEEELGRVHPKFAASARNLLHYVALRQFDIRDLQEQLARLGLSSLGRAERHVQASLLAVDRALRVLDGQATTDAAAEQSPFPFSNKLLEGHVQALLGDRPADRAVPIMVTLAAEAADDYDAVHALVGAGMDVARINCAHDSQAEWSDMIANVGRAGRNLGRQCRVVMDLGGPKFRTGPLRPGPRVMRLRPRRNALGQVASPRRVRCVADDEPWTGKKSAVVPVPRACIEAAEIGDRLQFRDTRGRRRQLGVAAKDGKGLIVELYKTAYIATGTLFRLVGRDTGEEQEYRFGDLPAVEQPILLHEGDSLVLTKDSAPGFPAVLDEAGKVEIPAQVSCQPVEVFDQIAVDDPVSLNDGKIQGIVESHSAERIVVRIVGAKPTGSRLRGNKGINFPATRFELSGITSKDRDDLEFIVNHADAVALSFVRSPDDIVALQEALQAYPDHDPGIVVKIETERAYRKLPQILLATMQHYPAGIMIARGDLAVECGWVSLAEIQEEILWMAEAAHVPVIWATQVLEAEAQKGLPTRAEITDAAMSQRADCVMLNKGPNILGAIRTLDKILRKMQRHQNKKTARLTKLSISDI